MAHNLKIGNQTLEAVEKITAENTGGSTVEFITPAGSKTITANGTHDVTNYASAAVNVPVPEGYIKPSGSKTITANGTHDVTNFVNAIVNVASSGGGGITPTGTINITANGTHDVTNYASAAVNVPVPSGYIDAASTKVYATRVASGSYTPSSDALISATSITVGFKPKIFVIRHFTGYNTTGTRPYVNNSWMVLDNDYEYTLHYPDGGTTNQARTGGTTAFTLSSSKAQSAQSNGSANVFWPTTNGVAGNGGSGSYYLKANITYFWFAWG